MRIMLYYIMNFTYQLESLPGEQYIVLEHQKIDRYYREWRMSKPNLQAYDIDAIVTTDGTEQPMRYSEADWDSDYAILEMKHCNIKYHSFYKLIKLPNPIKRIANKAKLPYYVVRYYPIQERKIWGFDIYPANEIAIEAFGSDAKHFSERRYVQFLNELRKKEVSEEYLSKFDNRCFGNKYLYI